MQHGNMASGGQPLPQNESDTQGKSKGTETENPTKREIHHTEKGLIAFQEECSKYKKTVIDTWKNVETCILRVK